MFFARLARFVIPAKAGIQGARTSLGPWVPAFAGTTFGAEVSNPQGSEMAL